MKFQIYLPVKPKVVNQVFGNPSPTYDAQGLKGHNGIDFNTYHGQPVYATHDGEAWYEIDSGGGHGVVIRTNETYDYEGAQVYMKSISWHFVNEKLEPQFKSPIKQTDINRPGQQVKAGDLIGYADSTGISSGDHLHFAIKPQAYDEQNAAYQNYRQKNGYLGAIDPEPFFNGFYAEDLNKLTKPYTTTPEWFGKFVASLKKYGIYGGGK